MDYKSRQLFTSSLLLALFFIAKKRNDINNISNTLDHNPFHLK